MIALDLFAECHPEVDIHLFGLEGKRLPFAAINHGLQTPEQLNELYNRCIAGLVLSATNVSLVPHEMLAAGCIPVVNDADHNRVVLDNFIRIRVRDAVRARRDAVRWSSAPRRAPAAAEAAAASVQDTFWDDAGAAWCGSSRAWSVAPPPGSSRVDLEFELPGRSPRSTGPLI